MPVVQLVLKSVEARRYQDPQAKQQIRIDHNSNLAMVAREEDDRLRVEWGYTTSYGALGVIKLEGVLRYRREGAGEAADTWAETRKLPDDMAQEIHSAILSNCVPEAVGLAKNLRLPPPIPMPQVQFKGKGAEGSTQSAPVDAPEIG